jgi:integrase/recombinase XerD
MDELKVAVKAVKLYRRHKPECAPKARPKKPETDCGCSVWFQAWMPATNDHRRWSSKTTNWDEAVKIAAAQTKDIEAGGTPWVKNYGIGAAAVPVAATSAAGAPEPGSEAPASSELSSASPISQAIAAFLKIKEKAKVSPDTLYRLEHTLNHLQAFCVRYRVISIGKLTSLHVSNWRTEWPVKSTHAERSFASRAKQFFGYCYRHKLNPDDLAEVEELAIKGENNDEAVRPLSPAEYAKVLAAIDQTDMIPENKVKANLCVRLQRESGLALVDACLLSTDELKPDVKRHVYTVTTYRQKTIRAGRKGSKVEVPISWALGQELLKLKNGNPEYFFWSGNTAPASASDGFQKHYRRIANVIWDDQAKAGIPEKKRWAFSSHDLRHTFAVESLKAGLTLRQLQKALGHSSVKVTETYYAKWSHEEKDELQGALRESLSVQSVTA